MKKSKNFEYHEKKIQICAKDLENFLLIFSNFDVDCILKKMNLII